jgi:ABC-type lipoprotein release transport system permease subunit
MVPARCLGAGVTRVISSYLYGVSPTDPVTFVLTPLLLGGVALAASAGPARRAARIDPLITLKNE